MRSLILTAIITLVLLTTVNCAEITGNVGSRHLLAAPPKRAGSPAASLALFKKLVDLLKREQSKESRLTEEIRTNLAAISSLQEQLSNAVNEALLEATSVQLKAAVAAAGASKAEQLQLTTATKRRLAVAHPSYKGMVMFAIRSLRATKGSTWPEIVRFIDWNHKSTNQDEIVSALLQLVDSNQVKQVGERYMIPPPAAAPPKEEKPAKKKM